MGVVKYAWMLRRFWCWLASLLRWASYSENQLILIVNILSIYLFNSISRMPPEADKMSS